MNYKKVLTKIRKKSYYILNKRKEQKQKNLRKRGTDHQKLNVKFKGNIPPDVIFKKGRYGPPKT